MQLRSTLLTLLLLPALLWQDVGATPSGPYGMDSKSVCQKEAVQLLFVEDGHSFIVLGKTTTTKESQADVNVCKIKFKPISKEGMDYLRIKFDSFYINDCGVTLTVSQSPASTFEDGVTELIHLKCTQVSPRFIYAQKDHTVLIRLSRDDTHLRNYNFRLNVSLSEGPPKTGPTVAVIIGISAALIAVIAVVAFILIKYIRLKNSVLRERRAERAIESALYVYSSQDLHRRDLPYTPVPGARQENGAGDTSGAQRNGSVNTSNERNLLLNVRNSSLRTNGHALRASDDMLPGEGGTESKASSDVEGDLPPSYEEALEMPKPAESPDKPIYTNT